jgi:hypothetical protein
LSWFQASPHHVRSSATTFVGTGRADEKNGPSDAMQQTRIALLERQVMELQRAVDEWQQAYRGLRQQFVETTGREPR